MDTPKSYKALSIRNEAVYNDFVSGMTVPKLVEKYGISKSRISGIIRDYRYKLQLEEARKDLHSGEI